MNVRLVVTGHDQHGKAVFVSDEHVAPIRLSMMPGAEFHRLWGSDEPQTYAVVLLEPNYHGGSVDSGTVMAVTDAGATSTDGGGFG